jgi:hypothetical protein
MEMNMIDFGRVFDSIKEKECSSVSGGVGRACKESPAQNSPQRKSSL